MRDPTPSQTTWITQPKCKYKDLKIELEKTKKEKDKYYKLFESKLINVNNELVNFFGKVYKIYEENVKMLEEKKVLQGIHKVNTDIHEVLK